MGKHKFKLSHSAPPQLAVQEISLQQIDKEFFQSNLGVLLYSLEFNAKGTDNLGSQQVEELQAVL